MNDIYQNIELIKKSNKGYLKRKVIKSLSKINQKSIYDNYKLANKIIIISLFLSIIYFIVLIIFVNKLWYHKISVILATIILFYMIIQLGLESKESEFRKKLPRLIRIFSYYYQHYEGNLDRALKSSIERVHLEDKIYFQKINSALNKENYEYELRKMKQLVNSRWIILFYNIIVFAKKDGNSNVISKILDKLSNIINYINVAQGKNNIEFLWIQIGLMILPVIFIPFVQIYNGYILKSMEYYDIYTSSVAENKAILIIVLSIISAYIVNAIRRVR